MGPWLLPIGILIFSIYGRLSGVGKRQRTQEMGRALQLDCDGEWLTGRLAGRDVRIHLAVDWVIHLALPRAMPPLLAIEPVFKPHQAWETGPRSFRALELKRTNARDLQWRELANNHEAVWSGPEAGALDALLTDRVISALATAAAWGDLRLDEDGLRGEFRGEATAVEIRAFVPYLDAVRQELERSLDGLFDRLLPLAQRGDSVAIRRPCLQALQHRFPERPGTREASRAATLSASPALRVTGATFLGAEGRPLLVALACDHALPAEVRVEALEALAASSPDDARRALGPILAQPGCPAPLLEAAITAATSLDHRAAAPAIAALASGESVLGACIARALERLGDSSCEAALLPLLEVEDEEVRLAAARALAVHGGLSAVEPLLRAARAGTGAREEIWTAARSIQSRLAGDAPGGLTIATAGPEDGAISIAPPTAGGVSVVKGRRRGARPPR